MVQGQISCFRIGGNLIHHPIRNQKANYPFPTYAASQFTIGYKCYVGTGVSAGNLFYSFDPFSNTWNPIASVPMGATDQLAFAVEDKGYYIYSNTLYEYDPIR